MLKISGGTQSWANSLQLSRRCWFSWMDFFSIGYIESGEWYLDDSVYYNLDESAACNDCREEYNRVYMKTYHNIHKTKEVRVDKIEAMKKKYATVNIDDEIDKWFFGGDNE
jgi:hypothetical protein